MTIRQLPFLLALSLTACGPTPEAADGTVAESSELPVSPTATAPETLTAAVPVPDQIEYTAEANPEVIDADQLPVAKERISQANQVKEPAAAPAPARQPTTKPVVQQPPARTSTPSPATAASPPSAPAPAPANANAAPAAPAPATNNAPISTPAPERPMETMAPKYPDHGTFNTLLSRHVNNSGNVNYAGLKQDKAQLEDYLNRLSENVPTGEWPRKEALAYWINAYNAYTLKLIVDNYPLKSITDLHGGKPWDVKWIELGGKTYSLNNIEHDIIRPRFREPRIHFAVNCAAASCPPLPNQAFTAANLNGLLESRTRAFVRNGAYNTITDGEVAVSKIFDWYGEDFGDLRNYLNKYATTTIPEGANITFREYDWALNKQ